MKPEQKQKRRKAGGMRWRYLRLRVHRSY
jgi:hypothetical protein